MTEEQIFLELNDRGKYPTLDSIRKAVKGYVPAKALSGIKRRDDLIDRILEYHASKRSQKKVVTRKVPVRAHTRKKGEIQVSSYVRTIRKIKNKPRSVVLRPKPVRKISTFLSTGGYEKFTRDGYTVLLGPGHYIAVGSPKVLTKMFSRKMRGKKLRTYKLYGFYNADVYPYLVFRSGKSYIIINPDLFKEALKITGVDVELKGYTSNTPLFVIAKGRPSVAIAPLHVDDFSWDEVEPIKTD